MDHYRYCIAVLLFFGLVVTYMLRVNLSVAILVMVNNTKLDEIEATKNVSHRTEAMCPAAHVVKRDRDGPFIWDATTRGIILGSFFYGYIVTELPGGWLAFRYGGKWVLFTGIFMTCVFTFITPLTVYLELPLLLAIRVLEGLCEGVAFPCVHALFAVWVPPRERARMPAFIFAAIGVGTVIAFPLSSALCQSEMGWPLVFYVFGVIGTAWCILWAIFGSSSPASCRWISQKEKKFIQTSLSETMSEEKPSFRSIPWCAILKTPSVWALWISHMSYTWGFYTLITSLPTYFKDILRLDMHANGLYSALPYMCFILFAVIAGPLADFIVSKGMFSVGVTRKIMDGIGHTVPGILLLASTAIGCNTTLAIALISLAVGSEGFVGAGYYANNLDVTGRFAGVAFGISNAIGTVSGILAPLVAGVVIQNESTIRNWRIVFGITAAIYWFAAVFFIIFGSGETASWAKVRPVTIKPVSDLPEKPAENGGSRIEKAGRFTVTKF